LIFWGGGRLRLRLGRHTERSQDVKHLKIWLSTLSRHIAATVAAIVVLGIIAAGVALADPPGPRPIPPGVTGADLTPRGTPFLITSGSALPGPRGLMPTPFATPAHLANTQVGTPIVRVGTPYPRPPSGPSYPNYLPANQALLDAISPLKGQPCPASFLRYHSQLLGASFCYPTTWQLVSDDSKIPSGLTNNLNTALGLGLRKEGPDGRELARLTFQVDGDRPFTLIDCPQPGALATLSVPARVCFHGSGFLASSWLIGITVPHKLARLPELWIAIELPFVGSQPNVTVSDFDRREALTIVSSLLFD
jgi:hypothetical protein